MVENVEKSKKLENSTNEDNINNIRKLGIRIDYGISEEEPAIIVMEMERKDGKGIVKREFIPEQAMNFAYDIGTKTKNNPKTAGIAIQREDGEIEMIAMPPESALQLAENMMIMAMKAKIVNDEKGFILKEEFKNKKPFIFSDLGDHTFN